jgi:hypothetical protein
MERSAARRVGSDLNGPQLFGGIAAPYRARCCLEKQYIAVLDSLAAHGGRRVRSWSGRCAVGDRLPLRAARAYRD